MTAIMGANQYAGKTYCNTARQAIQASALYPSQWYGKRWDYPISLASCSETTTKLQRTYTQKIFGPKHDLGSGWLPIRCIDPNKLTWSKRDPNVLEHAYVRHFNWRTGEPDGWSEWFFFSFEQGWSRVSGYTIEDVGISEEPEDIRFHDEMKNRTNKCRGGPGQLVMDMMPQLGETQLYVSYDTSKYQDIRTVVRITIDDCLHMSDAEIAQAKREGEGDPWVECRLYGRAVRGTGVVFRMPQSFVTFKPRSVWPNHFKVGLGIDIPHGVSEEGCFAVSKLLYDPEIDKVHVTDIHKIYGATREVHAVRINALGGRRIPVSWPHDTGRKEKTTVAAGPIVQRYRQLGCRMQYAAAYQIGPDGKKTNRKLNIVQDAVDREKSGRLVWSADCVELLEERLAYSQENGSIKDGQDDHGLDSVFNGLRDLRNFQTVGTCMNMPPPRPGRRQQKALTADEQRIVNADVDFYDF